MKIDLEFTLKNNTISTEYHSFIVSFFKKALEAYDEELYQKWYQGNPEAKPFTFSVYFDSPQFAGETITLRTNKISVHILNYDIQNALLLANAFQEFETKKIIFPLNHNEMRLNRVSKERLKPLEEDNIIVQMTSPLVVRNHNKDTNKDDYLTYQDEQFKEILKMNIQNTIEKLGYSINVDDFDIVPLKNKKTVVKLYRHSMNASLGLFQLKGNQELLDFLWKAGMGSHRSSGFGNFKIIK